MKIGGIKIVLVLVFAHLVSFAEGVDLETFESISVAIKGKKNANLLDETPLKVIPQYSQPQRKIQATTESSESALSTE